MSDRSWARKWWALLLALAAALRLWGLVAGPPEWHADEFYLVYVPLKFFSGNLNPGQDLTAFYPGFHYYLLALLYGLLLLVHQLAMGVSFLESLAQFYFWQPDALLLVARLTSVVFALGTVWWVGRLAVRVGGEAAGLCAGLLMAVGAIHVRQSGLAAVDVPMAFWYVGAVWAAVRLLAEDRWRDYALAGALVGLAAASKYPGALAGAATAVGHLAAGRSVRDGRIWAAGLVAIGAFCVASPYTLLDYETFVQRFSGEFGHLQRGRGELGAGWWYYLSFCLRHNLGWMGLVLWAVSLGWVARESRREGWVVLAGFISYWLFMGSGKLVFVRYALPLMALQAVLAGCVIGAVPWRRWRLALVLAALLEPCYGALRIAQLQGAPDTRAQARTWIEREVPAGTRLANFGGWAGDVPLRYFETFWLRLTQFERDYGRQGIVAVLDHLQRHGGPKPHYWSMVHSGNRQLEKGELSLIRDRDCAYVVLHRHALSYSRVDSTFAAQLAVVGKRVADFAPVGLSASRPRYDPIDAYYIPVADFGALRQAGPAIEIWHLDQYSTPNLGKQTVRQIFATGYAAKASTLIGEAPEQAVDELTFALELDADNMAALEVMAGWYKREGRLEEAARTYTRLVELYPQQIRFWRALAQMKFAAGSHAESVACFVEALARQPDHPLTHNNLAVVYREMGEEQAALDHWRRAAELDPYYAAPNHNIGLLHAMAGRYAEAIRWLDTALARDPTHADVHFRIAKAYQYGLSQPERALYYWQQGIGYQPDDPETYLHLIRACGTLGKVELLHRWVELFIARFPSHPQRSALQQMVEVDSSRSP